MVNNIWAREDCGVRRLNVNEKEYGSWNIRPRTRTRTCLFAVDLDALFCLLPVRADERLTHKKLLLLCER
jgi:hypothetical protein